MIKSPEVIKEMKKGKQGKDIRKVIFSTRGKTCAFRNPFMVYLSPSRDLP
jgi:hypothetical protein